LLAIIGLLLAISNESGFMVFAEKGHNLKFSGSGSGPTKCKPVSIPGMQGMPPPKCPEDIGLPLTLLVFANNSLAL
jgi:hypothetical protein